MGSPAASNIRFAVLIIALGLALIYPASHGPYLYAISHTLTANDSVFNVPMVQTLLWSIDAWYEPMACVAVHQEWYFDYLVVWCEAANPGRPGPNYVEFVAWYPP